MTTQRNGISSQQALDELERLYDNAVAALRSAIRDFTEQGRLPDETARQQGLFVYPELRLTWAGDGPQQNRTRAWGRFTHTGSYSTTITRPALLRHYLSEQLSMIEKEYEVVIEVGPSQQEIPYPYVIDGSDLSLDRSMSASIARHFPTTELSQIGDETADGLFNADAQFPLSHFDALRTDFSLARLRHYTGTAVEHFQPFVLFTNYTRYVDEFVRWAIEQVQDPNTPYDSLACAGDVVITKETQDPEAMMSDLAWKKHQMPAWHLTSPNRRGITLVNIGVGPSNAKTICDHLAVVRPHAWLMIGHCGGLRESQTIGDYVLAHAYLRDDHVLDSVLPPDIPIPSIAEVQRALYDATKAVSGMPGEEVKQRLRTGTVVTTDDRNWELRYSASALRFNLSRAVAVDMESATIAAQGYRFRVPYGTLLCVSDKPLHGEIKLPGQANRFYEGAISEHLQIGICAVELLRAEGDKLHSRKLRTFNEPPFR
ncbi:MAG: AMP nucleosidase [Pantoea sp.]|uniref:AMP nucleosidase n=1 Tax=Pantoea phytobeneficialis TaxID=2052056 RepID=A0AAP9H7C9_9GAMM|nr:MULTISPECIES: AMP nucleosidase [Pantoea]ERK17836.1 AMP nucleosidase [Pantoea sp. AS-PWVM4]MDO6408809.1 AMP nucleosidase [Pantoea phytobeneficialis]QGR07924.1 AMP nucleosidase [Pantoea phytobeneficialis]